MKSFRAAFLFQFALLAVIFGSVARAADGTWTSTTSGGNWSLPGNWGTGVIADGTGSTANFSTIDIVTDPFIVHLDSPRTIGNLIFGDTATNTAAGWTLDNNGNTGNLLLLDGTPFITVNALGAGKSVLISLALTGTAGLTKNGPGTLVLSGTNSYSGTTTVSAGTLQIGDGTTNGFLGSGPFVISAGSTLSLNYATSTELPWSAFSGAGTLQLSSKQAINGSANWNASALVALPAAFTGTIKLDNGRIYASSAGLGGTTSILVGNGGQFLGFDNVYTGAPYTYPQNFSINGMGWGETGYNSGALRVSGMSATFTGTITLTGNSGLFTQAGGASAIIATNTISDGGAGYGLVMAAQGSPITLSAANTYSGPTSISSGTLNLNHSLALQNSTFTTGGTLTFNSLVTSNAFTFGGLTGTANLTLQNSAAQPIALSVGNNNTPQQTFTGILLGSGSLVKVGTGTLTLGGANTYTGLTTVSGGVLNIQTPAGLGNSSAGTVVNANGTLQLNNNVVIALEPLTLSGAGASSGGALRSLAGSNTFGGPITLAGDARINTDAGSLLLTNTGAITGSGFGLTVGGAGNTTFSAPVSTGSGTFTKDGTGTAILSAANSFTGATTVNAGRLTLSSTNTTNITVNTNATLGGIGSTTGSLTLTAGSTLAVDATNPNVAFSANAVSVTGPATIVLDNAPSPGVPVYTLFTYGSLAPGSLANLSAPGIRGTLSDDAANKKVILTTTGGGGTRTWNAAASSIWNGTDLNWNEGDHKFANGDSVVFDNTAPVGAVSLAGTLLPGSVTINNNSLVYSFNGSGSIGGSTGLAKSGTGSLVIGTSNAFSGATTISAGVVKIQNANALGTAAGGTTVASGAALQIQGGITTPAEPLTLSGTGIANDGALRNISDTNTFAGLLTLGSDTRINSDAGSLVLNNTGSIGGGSFGLTIGGAGNTTINGAIATLNGSLTKEGGGTLALSGANSYSGGTFINGGILQIGTGTSNGTIGTGTYTLASGTTLYLNYATAAPPVWSNITGSGTLELNSAQAVNGSANWNPVATVGIGMPAGFTGTVLLDNGRVQGTPTGLGGTTNFIVKNGSQFLAFDGTVNALSYTYPQNFSLNGLGWGEAGYNLGALRVSGMNATFTGNVTLTGNSALFTQGGVNATMTIGGVISDGGSNYSLTINASGNPITLAGANTYGGNTLVSVGTLKVGNASAIPSGAGKGNVTLTTTLDLNGFNPTVNALTGAGTVTSTIVGPATLTVGANDQTFAFTGVVQNGLGTVGLTKVGTGTLTLSGANSFGGPLSVQNGTLSVATINNINANGILGNSSAPVSLGNAGGQTGILKYTSAVTSISDKPFTLATGGTGVFQIDTAQTSLILFGAIDGGGNLTKSGPGILGLGGASTYTGTTALNDGILQLQGAEFPSSGPLGIGGPISFGGGTLQFNSLNSADYSGRISPANQTIRIDTNGQAVTFASALMSAAGGSLSLNDTNPGTPGQLLLNGVSNFPGQTSVAAGDLRGTGALANSAVVVTTGFGSVWPGTASFGSGVPSTGETLTVAGVNLSAGGKLKIALNTSSVTSTQKLVVTGPTCNISGAVLSLGIPESATSANTYTVLSSTSPITGTFDTVFVNNSLNIANSIVTVTYTANTVKVKITGSVTPVTVNAFTARNEGCGVRLDWNCVSEYLNAGFNLYRRPSGDSEWQRLNPVLIAGRITNPDPKRYAFFDRAPEGVYEYRLESVSVAGEREYFAMDAPAVTVDWAASAESNDPISDVTLDAAANSFVLAASAERAQEINAQIGALSREQQRVLSPNLDAPRLDLSRLDSPAVEIKSAHSMSTAVKAKNAAADLASQVASDPIVAAGARWFSAASSAAAGYTAAKVEYQGAGVMLLDQRDMPAGFDLGHVTLQREGRAFSALARTPAGLLVYAPGYEDDYTNRDALFLRKTAAATAAGTVASASNLFTSTEAVNVTSPASVTREFHDVYFDYNLSPYSFTPWFSAQYLTQGTAQDFALTLPSVSSGSATLTVNLWSLTDSASSPDHALQVLVNGQPAGKAEWDGGGKMMQLTFDIPAGALNSENTLITLATPAIPGQDGQIALLHSLSVSYTRTLDGSKPLEVVNSGDAARLFELDRIPAAGVWVVDTRFPDRAALVPVELQAQDGGTFRARFRAASGGTGKYVVTPVGQENKPLAISRRDVAPLRLNGTYLATGPAQFSAGVQPLLTKRAKEGVRGTFADQERFFDYYNYGRYGPSAIQKAVQSARPKYLLLLGRTTYDYKNYSGQNVDPLCPAFLVSTRFWAQTTSDSQFGDLGRGYPEVAVGRLPVNDAAELAVAVRHILDYNGLPASGARLHAVADRADPAVADFSAQLESLVRSNHPELAWQQNYSGQTYGTLTETTASMTVAANGGADLILYAGHGNAAHLGSAQQQILGAADVSEWNGSAVLLQATCAAHWTAANTAGFKSLAMQALTQPQGGIAAGVGTSTYMNSEAALNFMNQLLANAGANGARWGDAVMKTQRWAVAQSGGSTGWMMDLAKTEQLFGDPAMPVGSQKKQGAAAPGNGTSGGTTHAGEF